MAEKARYPSGRGTHDHRRQPRLGRQRIAPRRSRRAGGGATTPARRWRRRHGPPIAAATDSAPAAARTPGTSCSAGHPASASASGSPSWVRTCTRRKSSADRAGPGREAFDGGGDGAAAAQLGRDLFERARAAPPRTAARGANGRSRSADRPGDRHREPRPAAPAPARTRRPAAPVATHADGPVLDRLLGCPRDVGVAQRARAAAARHRAGTRHRDRGPSARTRSAAAARWPAVISPAQASGPTIASTSVNTGTRPPAMRRRIGTTRRAGRVRDRGQPVGRCVRRATAAPPDGRRPSTSAIASTRRTPSRRRATNTTASMLDATCARTAASGSPESARSTRVSSRASASAGPLAWMVDIEPSCPVLSACSMSSASPPRTSPTTSRSGRIRSAARTSSRTVTPARALGVRRTRLEPHDVRLREPQLGRLLDGDDAFGVRDRLRQRVEQGGLARARRPGHQEVPSRADRPAQERRGRAARPRTPPA